MGSQCKKQGLLPLTFKNSADYDKVRGDDQVDLQGVKTLAPGSELTLVAKHKDGSKDEIPLVHSFNAGQSESCFFDSPFFQMVVRDFLLTYRFFLDFS